MFEFLSEADPNDALVGVHFAIRQITHRVQFTARDAVDSLIRVDAPAATKIGLRIINEIEQVEGAPVSGLNAQKAYYYKDMLATLAQEMARRSFAYDKKVGEDLLRGWRQERLPDVSTISVPGLPVSGGTLWGVATYLFVGSLGVAYLIYALWTSFSSDSEIVLIPKLIRVAVSSETRLLLLAMSAGAVGSFIQAMKSFTWEVGNRTLTTNWIWWYLLQPLTGMLLALLCYFAFRAGFLSVNATVQDISFFGVAALSGLIGMSSSHLVQKLEEVFNRLFKTGRRDTERLSNTATTNSR